MAITRTAMIDDDGSGTTGTIINNAWKSELYGQIDAADTATAAAGGDAGAAAAWPVYIQDVATGVQSPWRPTGFVQNKHTWIQWVGTADVTINGLAPVGVSGQRVTITNRSAGSSMFFPNNSGAVAATELFLNRVTSAPTVVGPFGSVTYHYFGTWILVAHNPGGWTPVPFNAANFSGAAGLVWTVGAAAIQVNRYQMLDRTLLWHLYISWFQGANVLSGTAGGTLTLGLPLGLTVTGAQIVACEYCQGVTGVPACGGLYISSSAAGTVIVQKATNANFATSEVPGIVTMMSMEIL